MRIADNTAEFIGHTLLVKLNRIAAGSDAAIASIRNTLTRRTSVKDRISL